MNIYLFLINNFVFWVSNLFWQVRGKKGGPIDSHKFDYNISMIGILSKNISITLLYYN